MAAGADFIKTSTGKVTSSLLNDVLMQIEFQRTGRYQDPDDFTLD